MYKSNNRKIYDYIIIGSGPSAVASLFAFPKKKVKLGIVSGFVKTKIEQNNNNYILDRLKLKYSIREFFQMNGYRLFSPGIIGGLSNFWGGGFFFTKYNDLGNYKKIFKNENEYKSIIRKFDLDLKTCFIQTKKKFFIKKYKKINGYYLEDRKVFKNKINNILSYHKSYQMYNSHVECIEKKNFFEINLQNKKKITCKKIILTAGVLGNISILKKSFKIKSFTFYDDVPWLVYLLNFNKSFLENFRLTNFINKGKSIDIFTSFYNLKFFKINELLSFLLKKKNHIFNFDFKISFPNIISFGQIWTKNTRVKIYLKNKNCSNKNIIKKDNKLINFLRSLKEKKIFKIYIKRQKAGYGFHYHNLNINYKNKNFTIEQFLKYKYGKNIICCDSSIISKTSPISVTSTIMAISYILTKKLIKN